MTSYKHNKIPRDPLEYIKACVRERRIFWTYQVNMRMKERFIPRNWILNSFDDFAVIESYPEDKYFPSYLVCSRMDDEIFHILFSVDVESNNVRIITAYKPDPDKWSDTTKRSIDK